MVVPREERQRLTSTVVGNHSYLQPVGNTQAVHLASEKQRDGSQKLLGSSLSNETLILRYIDSDRCWQLTYYHALDCRPHSEDSFCY